MRGTAPAAAALAAVILLPAVIAAEEDSADAALELEVAPIDLEYTVIDLAYPVEDVAGETGAVEGEVEALAIEETELEVKIELSGDILFEFDKANLLPAAEPTLLRVAEVIKKYRQPMVRVEGFTDSKGSDSYNLTLSQKRADSVKTWLVKKGAIGGVLTTKGWGEAKPVAPNENPDGSDNPEGRQKNRRVEITVKKN